MEFWINGLYCFGIIFSAQIRLDWRMNFKQFPHPVNILFYWMPKVVCKMCFVSILLVFLFYSFRISERIRWIEINKIIIIFKSSYYSVCNWKGTYCLSWKERYHLRVWTVFKVINSGHIYCHIKLLRCLKRWNVISISCFKSFDISLRSFEVTSQSEEWVKWN